MNVNIKTEYCPPGNGLHLFGTWERPAQPLHTTSEVLWALDFPRLWLPLARALYGASLLLSSLHLCQINSVVCLTAAEGT